MDYDRKSTVSSFYGAQRPSYSGLERTSSPSTAGYRDRDRDPDTASSFYQPEGSTRGSTDLLRHGQPGSAGYNSDSFHRPGREEPLRGGPDEEEGGFDVFADFNNAGPRYSNAFGKSEDSYQKIPSTLVKLDEPEGKDDQVELVTVPGLGPEWQKDELRNMTKAGRKEKKAETRREAWKRWNRNESGICGTYFTRKFTVYFCFGLCVAIGIVLAFTIPRVPTFSLNERQPLSPTGGAYNRSIPTYFNRAPANFSFPAASALEVDTNNNYLPLTFNSIHALVYDLDSGRQVGTGYLGHKTVPAKGFPIITLPLNFTYVADNDSDVTWANWYNGCRNKAQFPGGVRPGVRFRLHLDLDIAGLPGTRSTATQVSGADCPIELPANSS